MWQPELPDVKDPLRQGDLLADLPSPSRGTMALLPEGLSSNVKPSLPAIVLEQCCTVTQTSTVLVARIGKSRRMPPDHRFAQSLAATQFVPGEPYALYEHLLAPHETLPDDPTKVWVIRLIERVSVPSKELGDLTWLQEKRVARMTPLARAHLRAKMALHFSSAEDDDIAWLNENGYDQQGRPRPESVPE